MADERLRLVAEVQDQFTGPLDKLNAKLQRVAAGGQQAAKDMKKDFEGFHGTLSKTVSVMDGMIAPLRSMGSVSLGAGLGLGAITTAVAGFAKSSQQLKIMSTETGLAVNELRAFGNLGARFGVSAETMQGGVRKFSDEMSRLRKRYGETYSDLQAMNLGQLVEKLVAAPNMKAAIDAAMEQLSSMGDPVKRRKVAEMLFGTSDIGAVAGQVTGKYREMMDEILRMQGTLDEKTTKSADEFQKNLGRMGEAAERLKINTLGPILKTLNEIVIAGDRAGIRGNAEAMEGSTQERLSKAQAKRDFLASEAGGGSEKNADRIKSLEREIARLTDEIKRTRDNPAGPSGVSAIPMSYSGGSPLGGLIQRASFGGSAGFGAPGMNRSFGGFGDMGPPLDPNRGSGGSRGAGGSGAPAMPSVPGAPPLAGGYTGNDGRRASRSGMSAAGRTNVASWMEFFRKPLDQGGMGYTEEQARGQIAMMQGESGLNLNPGAMGDHDRSGVPHAFGTVQWSDAKGNDRFPRLRALAAERGTVWQDRATQQEMYRREMMGRYKGVYNRILGAQTGEQSLWAGIVGYENPREHSLAFGIRTPFLNRLRRDGAGAVASVPPGDENGNFSNGAPRALKPQSMASDASVPGQVAGGAVAGSRSGDAMMRRLYGEQAPVARGGRGTLHIEFGNAPPGMRARASMDDLFSGTTISKQRQMTLRGENDV